MTVVCRKPIERQIEVYEEEWQRNHLDALTCRDLEEALAVGIGLYTALEHVSAIWRTNVSRGVDEYRMEEDQSLRAMFQRWLNVCEPALRQIATCEERFGSVELAQEFRDCHERGRQALARWVAPVLQRSPGLRVQHLSDEEAARLEEVLQSGEARLRIVPRPL